MTRVLREPVACPHCGHVQIASVWYSWNERLSGPYSDERFRIACEKLRRMTRTRRHWCSRAAVVALALACTACSVGEASFTPDQVAETFARHGIPLSVIVEQRSSTLLAILRPSHGNARCYEALAVNVFRRSADVNAHLVRVGFEPGEGRFVTRSEDGRPVVGLVRNNVLVALEESDCFSEARVRKPLDALDE